MPTKPKAPQLRAPICAARFTKNLTKPDTEGKFANGKYKCDFVFDGDVDLSELTNAAVTYALECAKAEGRKLTAKCPAGLKRAASALACQLTIGSFYD